MLSYGTNCHALWLILNSRSLEKTPRATLNPRLLQLIEISTDHACMHRSLSVFVIPFEEKGKQERRNHARIHTTRKLEEIAINAFLSYEFGTCFLRPCSALRILSQGFIPYRSVSSHAQWLSNDHESAGCWKSNSEIIGTFELLKYRESTWHTQFRSHLRILSRDG